MDVYRGVFFPDLALFGIVVQGRIVDGSLLIGVPAFMKHGVDGDKFQGIVLDVRLVYKDFSFVGVHLAASAESRHWNRLDGVRRSSGLVCMIVFQVLQQAHALIKRQPSPIFGVKKFLIVVWGHVSA